MLYILQKWEEYIGIGDVSADLPSLETRDAFYAGVIAALAILATKPGEPEEDLRGEIRIYLQEMEQRINRTCKNAPN